MKWMGCKFFKLWLVVFVLIVSCQEPFEKVVPPGQEDAFSIDSPAFSFLSAISMKDGSEDNIVDRASCLSIVFPVSVTANGIDLILNSMEDLLEVEELFDRYATDDTLDINFPFSVVDQTHQTKVVNSQDELEILTSGCVEDGFDDDIECLDLIYPVTVNIYNTEVQKSRSLVLASDKDLYQVLENLSSNEFITFEFPIQMLLYDGSSSVINTMEELELVISSQQSSCDEDDDFDFNDDDTDISPVYDFLVSRSFKIIEFIDQTNQTIDFEPYILKFEVNDSLYYSDLIAGNDGRWRLFGDDGTIDLDLEFDSDSPLKSLQDRWNFEAKEDSIIYFTAPGSSETQKSLVIKITLKEPLILSEIITEGTWGVQQLFIETAEETASFNGYSFTFYPDGSGIGNDGQASTSGNWVALLDNTDQMLSLDFTSNSPYDLIREDWQLIDFSQNTIHLALKDNDGNAIKTLILSKL